MTLHWMEREKRFEYLSPDDSRLYAQVKDSSDGKDIQIKELLEKLAASSRSAHRMSAY